MRILLSLKCLFLHMFLWTLRISICNYSLHKAKHFAYLISLFFSQQGENYFSILLAARHDMQLNSGVLATGLEWKHSMANFWHCLKNKCHSFFGTSLLCPFPPSYCLEYGYHGQHSRLMRACISEEQISGWPPCDFAWLIKATFFKSQQFFLFSTCN